jgi:hypothetical protein
VSWYGHGLDPDPSFIEGTAEVTHHQVAKKTVTDEKIRCQGKVRVRDEPGTEKVCNRLLAEKAGRPWVITCPRCKTINRSVVVS